MAATLVGHEVLAGSNDDRLPVAAEIAMVWSAAAGFLHLLVAPSHLAEAWWLGSFFVGVGLAQLVLAVLVRRPLAVTVLLVALVATAGLIALYVASRTVDLWFMPAHGAGHDAAHLPVAGGVGDGVPVHPGDRVEPVGPIDLTCLLSELVVLTALLALLPARVRGRCASLLAVVAAAGLALALL